jgi:hypothetical protein
MKFSKAEEIFVFLCRKIKKGVNFMFFASKLKIKINYIYQITVLNHEIYFGI